MASPEERENLRVNHSITLRQRLRFWTWYKYRPSHTIVYSSSLDDLDAAYYVGLPVIPLVSIATRLYKIECAM